MDLAQKFIEVVTDIIENKKPMINWDEFFDMHNVPQSDRTDFAVASILRNVAVQDLIARFAQGSN
ncbi:hypothetical protein D3C71_1477140 [compost metagenome]